MAIFGRKRAPAWSAFDDRRDHERFVALAEQRLGVAGGPVEHVDTTSYQVLDGAGRVLTVDVGNAMRAAAQAEQDGWAGILDTYLTPVLSPAPDVDLDDPAALAAATRVRVHPPGSDPDEHVTHYVRPLAPGLEEVLVLDLPDRVEIRGRATWDALGLGEDALFELGRRNLAAAEPVEVTTASADPLVLLVSGDSVYTSSAVVRLDDLVTPGRHGELLGLPSRHTMLVHPIDDIAVLGALQPMIEGTLQEYERSPGRLASDLYWRTRGRLVRLPLEPHADGVRFVPPPEFNDLVERLSAEAGPS